MTYEINEINSSSNDTPVDLSDVLKSIEATSTSTIDDWSTEYLKLQLHYTENFTVKELSKICDYYEIDKRKKRKDELVEDIIIFENSDENKSIVETRKRLWFYVQELKCDKYFKKYIIWD